MLSKLSPNASPKQKQRFYLLHKRNNLDAAFKKEASYLIVQRVLNNFSKYSTCLLYRSLAVEVDTSQLFLHMQSAIFSPVTRDIDIMSWHRVQKNTKWKKGVFGVFEPVSGESWHANIAGNNILFCPLVGFDRLGTRLGMGMGCFDRWLEINRPYINAVVGLAFSCQELAVIEHEEHDQPLDFIITEQECIACQI
ncbi:MAG: 5-formyltetrahydrofolate cyclo-ligase [Mariprofundales bacterium]